MTKQLLYNLFDSHNDMFIAMTVISKTYVIKLKNHEHVTLIVNKVLNKKYSPIVMLQFIEQIQMYPKQTGYDAIINNNKVLEKIRQESVATESPTRVLTPTIVSCVMCDQREVKLQIKNVAFLKEPILFGLLCIG